MRGRRIARSNAFRLGRDPGVFETLLTEMRLIFYWFD